MLHRGVVLSLLTLGLTAPGSRTRTGASSSLDEQYVGKGCAGKSRKESVGCCSALANVFGEPLGEWAHRLP
jgi:hypothetical protein